MKILVTGGAGFIGSHLVERLLARGDDVAVVDSFDPFYPTEVKRANLAGCSAHPRFVLHEADIRDLSGLRARLSGGFDCIVHLAARAGVRPSIADPLTYQEVNVRGTQNLLELARDWNVRHFVFGSSSSVYGVNPRVPWREDDFALEPISPYASTKISAELLGRVYSHLYGIRFIALRFFTVFGPRQRPDLAIHKFTRLIHQGEPVPFFGDGTTSRDYTFVDDIVDGIVAAIAYDASAFEVINLGHDAPVTLTAMVETIENALGRRAILARQPEQPGDVPQTLASIDKARRLLGYSPRVSFAEGVGRFVDWFEEHSRV